MSCVVPGCRSRTGPLRKENDLEHRAYISYHRFPPDCDLRQKWIDAIGRSNWQWRLNHRLCSKHFERDCFENYEHKGRRLKSNAMPTLFLRNTSSSKSPNFGGKGTCFESVEQFLETEDLESKYNVHLDPLATESMPVLSVDRSKKSKQLLITIDARANDTTEDHNYSMKKKPDVCNLTEDSYYPVQESSDCILRSDPPVNNLKRKLSENPPEPVVLLGDSTTDCESDEDTEPNQRKKSITSNNPEYTIKHLERKVQSLRQKLRKKEEQTEILCKKVKEYTKNSEIHNILSGSFKELCKDANSDTPKTLDYTYDVIKFAITLYYLSPKAYDFVKKYLDLPHTNILQKYLDSGTFIIDLDELNK